MMEQEVDSFFMSQQNLLRDENQIICDEINALFEKHFTISSTQMYILPAPESMFREPPWQLENLQILKNDLNKMKSRLNDFDLYNWQMHTNHMNKAGCIVSKVRNITPTPERPELVTQAWCKFYEIVSRFSLVPLKRIPHECNAGNFVSVHLCEAPGAFIAALDYWLKRNTPDTRWDWLATTLNPYCEENSYNRMIADDRLIRHTLRNWCFGDDNTGDIMDLRNLDALIERSKSIDEQGRILLVTADGSINCTDVPGEQEKTVAQLHFCETVACMYLLHEGGNFLLKLFTLFEHQSVCLMYLLSCVFHRVVVTKPICSKPGNSEMYVVCTNFKGKRYIAPYLSVFRHYYGNVSPDKAMFNLRDIPNDFLQQIEECSKFFKRHQCQTIEDNINAFNLESNDKSITTQLHKSKQMAYKKYFRYCKLRIVPLTEIVGREKMKKSNNCFRNKKLHIDSYNKRCKTQNLEAQQRLLQICKEAEEIVVPMKKSYTWHLGTLPEVLVIQTGKLFSKVRSSRFCEPEVQQILNNIDNIVQNIAISFPINIAKELAQQFDACQEILSFQFIQNYNSHQTINEICNRLEKLQIGQMLILVGYSLLTQLNVGLLYLLGNSFDKTIVEILDNEGYLIKLENYQRNEKVLNYLHEILNASDNARKINKTIWSVIPITTLYECEQFKLIILLNHLMIKQYASHIDNRMK